MTKEKAIIIYSGGMDSFTLINDVHLQHYELELYALTFDYGQRHEKEIGYAKKVCKELNINHKIIDITSINELLQGSSLTTSEIEIPHGHYAADNMNITVVPNRNMILLSLAMGYAISIGVKNVFYGAHCGDHQIYLDCRPVFVEKMNEIAKIIDRNPIEIIVPYLDFNKTDILRRGLEINLDYSNTWTCYEGKEKSCGKCGACIERLEAFRNNNVKDPLEYQ